MVQDTFRPPAQSGELAIKIRNGNFAWQKDGDELLKNVDLDIPAGQLIIVVGEVCSSFFSSLADKALILRWRPHLFGDLP